MPPSAFSKNIPSAPACRARNISIICRSLIPSWLKTIRVLLTVGENDKGHWVKGDKLEDKREMFMGAKYAAATRGAHVVLIPRYGHVGYSELHNEKIAYLWLWAYKSNYFE